MSSRSVSHSKRSSKYQSSNSTRRIRNKLELETAALVESGQIGSLTPCSFVHVGEPYTVNRFLHIIDGNDFIEKYDSILRYLNKCNWPSPLCELFSGSSGSRFNVKKRMKELRYQRTQAQMLIYLARKTGEQSHKNDKMVGIAQFYYKSSDMEDHQVLYLDNLCTLQLSKDEKTSSNCKLGNTMLQHLYSIASTNGVRRLELKSFNDNSTSYYKHIGYTEFEPSVPDEYKHFYHDF